MVNQALHKLMREKNTTISIAHRLSTIKRSDRIICIGNDGTVVEEGTYDELSRNKDGAFSKLMEWQLSGDSGPVSRNTRYVPQPSEIEEIDYDLGEADAGETTSMSGNDIETAVENSTPKGR